MKQEKSAALSKKKPFVVPTRQRSALTPLGNRAASFQSGASRITTHAGSSPEFDSSAAAPAVELPVIPHSVQRPTRQKSPRKNLSEAFMSTGDLKASKMADLVSMLSFCKK